MSANVIPVIASLHLWVDRGDDWKYVFVPRLYEVYKPTMQLTSDVKDFVNAKSHAREKPLLAG